MTEKYIKKQQKMQKFFREERHKYLSIIGLSIQEKLSYYQLTTIT